MELKNIKRKLLAMALTMVLGVQTCLPIPMYAKQQEDTMDTTHIPHENEESVEKEESENVELTSFSALADEVKQQIVKINTEKSALILPMTLKAMVKETETSVSVTKWVAHSLSEDNVVGEEVDFDSSVYGKVHIFTPVLEEGYILAKDVCLPEVKVTTEMDELHETSDSSALESMGNSENGDVVIEDNTKSLKSVGNYHPHDISLSSLVLNNSCEPNCIHYIYGSSTTDTIIVNGGKHGIILENVSIDVSDCAFMIKGSATVDLVTIGTNTLTSGSGDAGIQVESGNTLMLSGQGILTANGGVDAAGIGGSEGYSAGTIIINNGTVNANGQDYGAGIGGGEGGIGGNITINGGTVNATGDSYSSAGGSAGIGGGDNGAGGTITITGGVVNATGGGYGAAIGGGDYGAGGTIKITGGTVYANGGVDAAGIGGGEYGSGGNITIESGKVIAKGNDYGAGIGGGQQGQGGNITITGGEVSATGDYYMSSGGSAGIGGGDSASGGIINITGGIVNAIGGSYSAGIGSGDGAENSGDITITGGKVTAKGGTDGAGIGGGNNASGSTIKITGGIVEATGGYLGAGIGGGDGGASGTITIDGNVIVFATGGQYGSNLGGGNGGNNGSIYRNNGLIFEGDTGKIYGTSFTIGTNLSIPENTDLQLRAEQSLFVSDGVTLTLNGYIVTNGGKVEKIDSAHIIYPEHIITEEFWNVSKGDVRINNNCGPNCKGHFITGKTTTNTITIDGGIHNVTISDVTVESIKCAFMIKGSAIVNLKITGANTLKSGSDYAGIQVDESNSITIDGEGKLSVTAGSSGAAGIGGGDGKSAGNITIKGGTLNVKSITRGAAVGGGYNGAGGSITIEGGTLNAYGNDGGASIGGGYGGSGGKIRIDGGTVLASHYGRSAGIGGGYGGSGGNITINGGEVFAIKSYSDFPYRGAGIGGGDGGSGGNITINGGNVCVNVNESMNRADNPTGAATDSSNPGPAGIGGGNDGAAGTIIINDGTVNVKATFGGAGIGSGCEGAEGNIIIKGGNVTATGGIHGTGIGGGTDGAAVNITIDGGSVTATGGGTSSSTGNSRGGVGIGGGYRASNNGRITITGGTVNAKGNHTTAGIGGGYEGTGGSIEISGGTVNATGGDYGVGIGGSYEGKESTGVVIKGGSVNATGGSYSAGIGVGYKAPSNTKVEINGGIITAIGGSVKGSKAGAGIGGSYGGSSGSVIINGDAVVFATSGGPGAKHIGAGEDGTEKTHNLTKGIIYEGNAGKLYGKQVTLPKNTTLSSGKNLTLNKGDKLTIPEEITLTNNATLFLNQGILEGKGTLNGSGMFNTLVTSEDIVDFADQVYTGSAIKPKITINPVRNIMDKDFTVIRDGFSDTYENNINIGTAQAGLSKTVDGTNIKILKNFKIVKSGTIFENGIKVFNGDEETKDFSYGDVITVKAKPTEQPVKKLLRTSPNEMALYVGDKQLCEPVKPDGDGVYTMNYHTKGKDLTIGENIVTVNYTGNDSLGGYAEDLTLTLKKKKVTAVANADITKVYDGNTKANITLSIADGDKINPSDEIMVSTTASYDNENVGAAKNITLSPLSITGAEEKLYTVNTPTNISGSISKKTLTNEMVSEIENSYVYTGKIIEPVPSVLDKDPSIITTNDYTIYYGENTNVGKGSVTVTGKGNYTDEVTKDFSITKADGKITITGNPSKAYDGDAVKEPAVEKNSDGTVSVEWYQEEKALTSAPKEKGKYIVKVILAEGSNHEAAVATKEFTIADKEGAISITGNLEKTYDGNVVKEPAVDVHESTGAVSYEWYQNDKKLDSAPVNAGSYKVKVILAADKDYTNAEATKEFNIIKAAGKISIKSSNLGKEYDGAKTAKPEVDMDESDGTVSYEWYEGTTKLESAPVNAGSYKVKTILAEGTNHTASSDEKAFVITKAIGTLNITGLLTKTYDGKTTENPIVEKYGSNGAVSYEWYQNDKKLESAPIDAGNYKVKAFMAIGINHTAAEATKEFNIIKAAGKISIKSSDLGKEYDGEKTADPVVDKHESNGDVTYEWYEGNTKLDSAPVNAGSYKVKTILSEDTNHEAAEATKEFTITKASGEITINDSMFGKEYDGAKVANPVVDTHESNGAVTYEWYEGNTKLDSAPVNAGSYKVKTILSEDTNYTASSDEKEFEITKKAGTLDIKETLEKTYDGNEVKKPTVDVHGSNGTVRYEWYEGTTKLDSEPVNAGNYKVKVVLSEGTNHTASSAEESFRIIKAKGSLSIKGTLKKAYDGNNKIENLSVDTNGSNGAVSYEWYEGTTKLDSVPINVGIYKIKAIMAEGKNHTASSDEKEFIITKATGEIKITGNPSKAYDGNTVKEPAVEKNSDGVESYEWYQSDKKLTSAPKEKGKYLVKAILAEGSNHKAAEATKEFTIADKEGAISITGNLEKTYDGKKVEKPAVDVHGSTGAVNYEWYQGDKKLDTEPVNAGSYRVKVVLEADTSYTEAEVIKEFKITKAAGSIDIENELGKVYDNKTAKEPSVTKNSDGDVMVEWYQGKAKLDSAPINVGDYKVKAILSEGSNHAKAETVKEFSITKAVGKIEITKDLDKTYDGKAVEDPEVNSHGSNGEVHIEWYQGANKLDRAPINVGSYRVEVVLAEGTNHTASSSVEKEFVITKADGEIKIIGNPSKAYDGDTVKEPAVEKNSDGTVSVEWYQADKVLTSAPKEKGKYIVKVILAEGSNHEAAEATKEFTIADNQGSISITGNLDKTYDGKITENPTVDKHGSNGDVSYGWYQNDSKLDSAPINAGSYRVKVKLKAVDTSYTDAEAIKDFKIRKAKGEITITSELTKAYDGKAVKEPGIKKNSDGVVSYEWYQKDKKLENAPVNVGNYKVKAILSEGTNHKEASEEKAFNIAKVDTVFEGGVKVYNDGIDIANFVYGDTITIKAKPKATKELKQKELKEQSSANEMILYLGDQKLCEPVKSDKDGVYTMTYHTKEKNLVIGENILTVKYKGNETLAEHSENVTVTLNKKEITATSDTNISKVYDGNVQANVLLSVADKDKISSSDEIIVSATATYDNKHTGIDKNISLSEVSITGAEAKLYSVKVPTSTTGTIRRKAITFKAEDMLNVKQGSALPAFTYQLVQLAEGDYIQTQPKISSNVSNTNKLGEYVITISGAVITNDQNYTITYENGKMTIVSPNQSVKVIGGKGSGKYLAGETVSITADDKDGYIFVGWSSEDGIEFEDSKAKTTTFKMLNKEVSVTANYKPTNTSSPNTGDKDQRVILFSMLILSAGVIGRLRMKTKKNSKQ